MAKRVKSRATPPAQTPRGSLLSTRRDHQREEQSRLWIVFTGQA